MSDLLDKKCVPCEGGVKAFDISEIHKYQKKGKKLFGSIEMDSYLNGWITKKQLRILINQMPDSKYKEKLSSLA